MADTDLVQSKLAVKTVADPTGRSPGEDPWAAFRTIELIALDWEQHYRHSLGKNSRFFLALEERRFLATRCLRCGSVWAPPRPVCARCLAITGWIELSGHGRVAGFTVQHYAPSFIRLETPYVLAYVALDGADTLFAHLVRGVDPRTVEVGLPVQVAYASTPVQHPLHLMWFEPARTVAMQHPEDT
jgi:uncharacterized OB-fold protein